MKPFALSLLSLFICGLIAVALVHPDALADNGNVLAPVGVQATSQQDVASSDTDGVYCPAPISSIAPNESMSSIDGSSSDEIPDSPLACWRCQTTADCLGEGACDQFTHCCIFF